MLETVPPFVLLFKLHSSTVEINQEVLLTHYTYYKTKNTQLY